jgi:hypothetical protein
MRVDQPRPASRSVSLHIERLVLDGVSLSGTQGAQLRGALIRELTRLLEHGGIAPSPGAVATLAAPRIRIARDSSPATIGMEIARSVQQSLNPSA